jgi:hypothetical protein
VKFKDQLAKSGESGADKFTLIGTPDGEVLAYVKPEASLDVGIAIMDSKDNILASANDAGAGGPERVSYKFTGKTGAYKIVVIGKTEGAYEAVFVGSEKIFFELNSNYLVAGNLPAGKAVGYAFVGSKDQTLTVMVSSDPKAPIDTQITIVDYFDLKTVLASANKTGQSGLETLTFPLPKSSIYIILVSDAGKSGGSFLMVTGTKK